ncbi:hypothetical protein ACFOZ7_12505 [Natribaculum luteum]|uniref:Uncharacterized protein n=1 Tax=Natribaculum luteum TaxID=1586232 RepID=A0ABD5P1C9_9EURY|nr:hypothetical protein [Natribaculum luteum]
MEEPSVSVAERWMDLVCRFNFVLYLALILEGLFLLLSVASAISGPQDHRTRTILLLNFVLLGIAMTVTVGLLYLCRRHRQ